MVWPNDPALWASAAHISLFAVLAWRSRCLLWLSLAVLLWLAADFLLAGYLPNLVALRRLILLYAPHFYIASSSCCMLLRVQKIGKGRWRISGIGSTLSLYVVSTWAVTAAAVILFLLVWRGYPTGILPYILAALLDMYFLQPLFCLMMQLTVMLLLYLHRLLFDGGNDSFAYSLRRFYSALAVSLIIQAGYILAGLVHLFFRI